MTWLADIFRGWKPFAPPNTERPGRKAFYARRRVRRDKRRRLAKLVRKQARERKAGRRFMRRPTWATMLLFIFAACVVDHSPRPCERLQHHTTTGHVVLCDCTCGDDPRFACPDDAVCDADIEDDDWRWPDAG